jgi:hypothetical protein
MKKLLSILLLTISIVCLNGCRNYDLKFVGEQCSPVFSYVDETQKLIDVDKSYCNTRQYQINLQRVGPIQGTEAKKPIQYCDRCLGFKNYAQFVTFMETVRLKINEEAGQDFQGITRETTEPAFSSQVGR